MLPKLFVLAAVALSFANAQSTFTFKETYPAVGSIPTAKPEWLALLNGVTITKAPVYDVSAGLGPQPQEQGDPYCDWTFTGCLGPDDISFCPKGQWGITYDDGPSEFSPALYDELDKTGTKATFFMVGGQVNKYPQHVLRAYKAGHDIAMHTWSHSYMTSLTNEQIVAELKWNEQVIKEVIGVSPKYFRPPYGDIDNRVRDIAKALGFTAVIWNFDTNDWAAEGNANFKVETIDAEVAKWAAAAPTSAVGGVSLEHDLYESTVNIALRVLPVLQKAYDVTSVGQCSSVSFYKEGSGAVTNTTAPVANSTVSGAVASGSAAAAVSAAHPSSVPVSAAHANPTVAAGAAGSAGVVSKDDLVNAASASGSTTHDSGASSTTISAFGLVLTGLAAYFMA
ncbi:carbohydrate esterase family 4 protein [Phycomyces blakesleeanus]|uniref:Carbohydrate esterase family 4 protein n=2 Tax=Phycomyces blakesleeanus TaxID=4837 RepID=A0A162TLT1_PHYB8|nr:carbohydrate esterase family 4 protein [Phycomyces blakesleeanus NRRL 1555(-)]OAD68153.1 carbohydrate esterase family 4 protein [Phycomyces blakesleeanus NRRL 1555(-)]|eukprot:XP_018286193.1 carbohydrate esterase family 4 protein [Phycomyces blakesleeanus NRRL 1555(-)]